MPFVRMFVCLKADGIYFPFTTFGCVIDHLRNYYKEPHHAERAKYALQSGLPTGLPGQGHIGDFILRVEEEVCSWVPGDRALTFSDLQNYVLNCWDDNFWTYFTIHAFVQFGLYGQCCSVTYFETIAVWSPSLSVMWPVDYEKLSLKLFQDSHVWNIENHKKFTNMMIAAKAYLSCIQKLSMSLKIRLLEIENAKLSTQIRQLEKENAIRKQFLRTNSVCEVERRQRMAAIVAKALSEAA